MTKFGDAAFNAFANTTPPRAVGADPAEESEGPTATAAAVPGAQDGAVLVDEIGAAGEGAADPAPTVVEVAHAGEVRTSATPAAAAPVAEAAAPKPTRGAQGKGAGTKDPALPKAARGSAPGRQGGTQRRTGAVAAAPTAPAAVPEAVPGPRAAGYVERGAPVAFVPPASAAVPKRYLNTARGLGMQWVSVNMHALEVRAEYDQACDEVRTLCAAEGLPAAAVEAALLDMGASIGAPVAAPVDAEAGEH